jgi:WD40 repeat protein
MNLFLVSQIDAHAGSVNDLAFSYPNKQLCFVTCGEDRVIKVSFCYVKKKKKLLFLM